jgi:hypothetical protein
MNDITVGENYINGENLILTADEVNESESLGNRVYTPIYIHSTGNISDIQFTSSIGLGPDSLGNMDYEGNHAYITDFSGEIISGIYEILEELAQSSTCKFIPYEPIYDAVLWIRFYSGDELKSSYIPNDSADKINLVISTSIG